MGTGERVSAEVGVSCTGDGIGRDLVRPGPMLHFQDSGMEQCTIQGLCVL